MHEKVVVKSSSVLVHYPDSFRRLGIDEAFELAQPSNVVLSVSKRKTADVIGHTFCSLYSQYCRTKAAKEISLIPAIDQ